MIPTVLLACILPLLPVQDDAPQKARAAVPGKDVQDKLARETQTLLKAQYAKRDPESRKALARMLMTEAAGASDKNQRFVFLTEARDLSADAGDFAGAFKAIDRIAAQYELPPPGTKGSATSMKLEVLKERKATMRSREERVALAQAFLSVAREGIEAEDFPPAVEAAKAAASAARSAGQRDLAADAKEMADEISALEKAFKEARTAELALSVNPDDPEANLKIGRYYCFFKNDWARGVPCLAKGADARLKEVAEQELKDPQDPDQQAALGDAWFDLSKRDRISLNRKLYLDRAGTWYSRAVRNAKGLLEVKLRKRLGEIYKDSFPRQKLVLHFDFEGREPNIVKDRSGMGHDAKVIGSPPHHPAGGARRGVYRLNGTTDWLSVGRQEKLKMPDVVSLSAWICPATFERRMQNVLSDHAPAGNNGKILRLHNNRIEFLLGPEGQSGEVGARLGEAKRWYHVVATYDGKTARFYLNGALTESKPRPGKISVNVNPLLIGKSGFSELYIGLIDDIMIFHRTLTDNDVRQLYRSQGGR